MADEPNVPSSEPPAPAGGSPTPQEPVTPTSPSTDQVTMARELGEAKAKLQALEDYQQKVDPVLQTIYSDQDVYNKVLETHNKRLGVTPADPKPGDPIIPAAPSPTELDNRNAHIANIVKEFYVETGVDKLDEENKKAINISIMSQLRDTLDPNGNKTDVQIFNDVSLTKLPKFLRDAHFLATKEDQLKAAEERGRQGLQQEATGILGSFSSSSIEPDSIVLTEKEKQVAARMNVDPAKYLENKKKLMTATPII